MFVLVELWMPIEIVQHFVVIICSVTKSTNELINSLGLCVCVQNTYT
jgi:hypothetical protein